mgnify:CR=1 FL=1
MQKREIFHIFAEGKAALGNLKAAFIALVCITNILNYIIMLGINAPKVLAKGKYAQAVRKAALASIGAKAKKDDTTKTSNYPYKFEWNLE